MINPKDFNFDNGGLSNEEQKRLGIFSIERKKKEIFTTNKLSQKDKEIVDKVYIKKPKKYGEVKVI